MPYVVSSLRWAFQLLVDNEETSLFIPVLSLMHSVALSKLTSLGLAFLVSQEEETIRTFRVAA